MQHYINNMDINNLSEEQRLILFYQNSLVNTLKNIIIENNNDKELLNIANTIVKFNHDNLTFMELLVAFSKRINYLKKNVK